MTRNNTLYDTNKFPKRGIIIIFFIIVFADFLANDKPILCSCDGQWQMPVLMHHSGYGDKDYSTCSYAIYPPIRYNPYQIDLHNSRYTSPLGRQNTDSTWKRHWLGTDKIGRDVAAGIIHGARLSLLIGMIATIFGLLLGLPYGLALGYFQDHDLRMNVLQITLLLSFLFCFVFYSIYASWSLLSWFLWICLGCVVLGFLLVMTGKTHLPRYALPLDLVGFRILEWRKSIPALFLLLAVLSLFSKPSIWNVIFLVSLLSWSDIARLIRAETLQLKKKLYVQAGITMGFSHTYLIRKYIFPGLRQTVLVIAMYMMAGSVLTEATLSFLGLGLPVEEVTWGKMLAASRDVQAWWMAVFPGACLISLLYWLHTWSGYMTRN